MARTWPSSQTSSTVPMASKPASFKPATAWRTESGSMSVITMRAPSRASARAEA